MSVKTAIIRGDLPCSSWNDAELFSEELASSRKALNKNSIGFDAARLTSTYSKVKPSLCNQLLHLVLNRLLLRSIPSLEGVNIHETEGSARIRIDQFCKDRVEDLVNLVLVLSILILLSHSV